MTIVGLRVEPASRLLPAISENTPMGEDRRRRKKISAPRGIRLAMRHLLVPSLAAATLLVACGPDLREDLDTAAESAALSADEAVDEAADEATEKAVEKASLLRCGTGCPAGYYPAEYLTSINCPSFPNRNQTRCNSVEGAAFTTCGLSCPSNYHPLGYDSSLACHFSFPNDNNTRCELNAGASFWSCGWSCPSGYVVAQVGTSIDCGAGFPNNNRVRCDSTVNGSLSVSPALTMVSSGQAAVVAVVWSTVGASSAHVSRQDGGGPEIVLFSGTSGNSSASVPAGTTTTFRLYGNGQLIATRSAEARVRSGEISARPRNVTIPAGQNGSTRITWNSNLSNAQVSVSVDGAAATLFAGGASGAQDANWLVGGHVYRFILHPVGQLGAPLATDDVVTIVAGTPVGHISATPNVVPVALGQVGHTMIIWSTNLSDAVVSVSMNGQAAVPMTSGASGATDVPWIVAGSHYLFFVHPVGQPGTVLASVQVVGQVPAPLAGISASPTQVVVPLQQTGHTQITWTTNLSNAVVSVSMDGQPAVGMTSGASGTTDVPWIVAGHRYRFFVHPVGQPGNVLALVDVVGVLP